MLEVGELNWLLLVAVELGDFCTLRRVPWKELELGMVGMAAGRLRTYVL
jgi:hypothetical protein